MTSEELDEGIAWLYHNDPNLSETQEYIKRLIRDCIEAVTPEKGIDVIVPQSLTNKGFNMCVDEVEANTKELLG